MNNIFDSLLDTFTTDDVRAARVRARCSNPDPTKLIASWKARGRVIALERGRYQKTNK